MAQRRGKDPATHSLPLHLRIGKWLSSDILFLALMTFGALMSTWNRYERDPSRVGPWGWMAAISAGELGVLSLIVNYRLHVRREARWLK